MNKTSKERKLENVYMYITKSSNGTVSVTLNPSSFYAKGISKYKSRRLKYCKIYVDTKDHYYSNEDRIKCGKI